MKFIPLFLPLLPLFFPRANALPTKSQKSTTHPVGTGWDFSWGSITPSHTLKYHPCYEEFLCARLLLPLDYLSENTANSPQATIAIIKLPSTSTKEHAPDWGGPIFINPGGPGISGVEFILTTGKSVQTIVGGRYSIIGVDPRGVNNTIPHVSCFETQFERQLWEHKGGYSYSLPRVAGTGHDPVMVGEAYVRGTMLGQICSTGKGSEWAGKNGDAGKFIGTTSTARDLYEINKAEWALGGKQRGLQYWGFSYGSVLGLTYAKLFPDNVDKLIVDGVVDVPDFLSLKATQNINDADKVLDTFFSFCSTAGPLGCPFHTGTTPHDIRKRLKKLMHALLRQPLSYYIPPSTASHPTQPDLFTLSDLRVLIYNSLSSSMAHFGTLAIVFTEIEKLLSQTPPGSLPPKLLPGFKVNLQPTCPAPGAPKRMSTVEEAQVGVLCSDGPPQHDMSLSAFQHTLTQFRKQSPMVGDIWATKILPCVTWPHQAKWKVPLEKFVPASSAATWPANKAPIFLLSTSLDPYTPLHNAHTMAKLFPKGGAVVAVQEGEGHSTISAVSLCMVKLVQKYLTEGVVDGKGTRMCKRDHVPFSETLGVVRRDEKSIEVATMKKIGQEVLKIAMRGKVKTLGI